MTTILILITGTQTNYIHTLKLQLKTQINELEKGQQNNENKTKLERLKEMLSKEKKNQIFHLEPEQFSPEVNVKHHHTSTRKQKLCCKMNQIPANSNDEIELYFNK